jgi:hypothetical protein
MTARRLISRESKRESANSSVQVIARAGAILRALGQHPDGLTIGQISQLVSVPRSTMQ